MSRGRRRLWRWWRGRNPKPPRAPATTPTPDPRFGFYYDRFLESEGLPVYEGYSVDDVGRLALKPWPRLGAMGAYLRLHGHQGFAGAYVLEIAPGQRTLPERHLYDEILYVESGSGLVRLWQRPPVPAEGVACRAGSLLGIPLNASHCIENTGAAPLRVVGFTNAPTVLDFYRSPEFVFGSDFVFGDRWQGALDAFEPGPVRREGERWPAGDALDPFVCDFVADVRALGPVMHEWDEKRAHFATLWMNRATLAPHVSAWPPESYQAAHRHNGGASVLLLAGEGFFLMWPREAGLRPWQDGRAEAVVRGELRPGSLYSPPTDWYHLHFNASPEPALYLAVTVQGRADRVRFVPGPDHEPVLEAQARLAAKPRWLIRPKHEDPWIRRLFERELEARQRGVAPAPTGRETR
ncbi:MAG: hypothetical protein MJE66_21080 [Proteobacteria bacterium]|nr:hypothetical protein [Pseudomonadota bacterium]